VKQGKWVVDLAMTIVHVHHNIKVCLFSVYSVFIQVPHWKEEWSEIDCPPPPQYRKDKYGLPLFVAAECVNFCLWLTFIIKWRGEDPRSTWFAALTAFQNYWTHWRRHFMFVLLDVVWLVRPCPSFKIFLVCTRLCTRDSFILLLFFVFCFCKKDACEISPPPQSFRFLCSPYHIAGK
jgi:hypothetical protein